MRRPMLGSRLTLVLALSAAAGAAIGCQSGADTSLGPLSATDTAVAGSYDLVAINGLPLPSTTQISSTQAVQVQGERIVVATDHTWADTSTTVVLDLINGGTSAPTITASSGTLAFVNGTINFVTTSGGGAAFTGSVNKDTLTVEFTGTRFVYVK